MTRHRRMLPLSAVAVAAIAVAATAPVSRAQDEFDEARVIIEINATDGDAGFQAMGDGEGWRHVSIYDPDEGKIFDVKAKRSLRQQGLTEIFFESEEPSCGEFSLEAFLERFPPGEYVFTGTTTEGAALEGEAILTHNLPPAPEITPFDEVDEVDPNSPVIIEWEKGNDLGKCSVAGIEPSGDTLFGYQVVVEREDPAPLVVFTVDLPNTATQVTVPPEFIQPEAIYKFEVIAIEAREDEEEVERGNQTISESFFCTSPILMADCELPD